MVTSTSEELAAEADAAWDSLELESSSPPRSPEEELDSPSPDKLESSASAFLDEEDASVDELPGAEPEEEATAEPDAAVEGAEVDELEDDAFDELRDVHPGDEPFPLASRLEETEAEAEAEAASEEDDVVLLLVAAAENDESLDADAELDACLDAGAEEKSFEPLAVALSLSLLTLLLCANELDTKHSDATSSAAFIRNRPTIANHHSLTCSAEPPSS